MTGDMHKPESSFSRWVNAFQDGLYDTWRGDKRVPSCIDKRYNRRWRRREAKRAMEVFT